MANLDQRLGRSGIGGHEFNQCLDTRASDDARDGIALLIQYLAANQLRNLWTQLHRTSGPKIWQRNKLYHHIYKSLVTIYDVSSKDPSRFHEEMDNLYSSFFRMLVEDKITDEQFEKLLKR